MTKVFFHIFGKFDVEVNGKKLTEEDFHSSKLIQLLLYIVLNKGSNISCEELRNVFYESAEEKKAISTLKNMVCRLRKEMKSLTTEELILTRRGGYEWNPEVEVTTDLEVFRKKADEMMNLDTSEQLWENLREALVLTGNEFSGKLTKNFWFRDQEQAFKETRRELMNHFCEMAEQEGNWETMQERCSSFLQTDPEAVDIHCYTMKSLSKQGNFSNAYKYYDQSSRMLGALTGTYSAAPLHQMYREVSTEAERSIRNLDSIIAEVMEAEKPRGAYNCDFETFRNLYQLEARKVSRIKEDAKKRSYLFTITLINQDLPGDMNSFICKNIMSKLGKTIANYLRISDVYSQSNPFQFIAIIGECTEDEAKMVVKRIQVKGSRYLKQTPYRLINELQELKNYEREIV